MHGGFFHKLYSEHSSNLTEDRGKKRSDTFGTGACFGPVSYQDRYRCQDLFPPSPFVASYVSDISIRQF